MILPETRRLRTSKSVWRDGDRLPILTRQGNVFGSALKGYVLLEKERTTHTILKGKVISHEQC